MAYNNLPVGQYFINELFLMHSWNSFNIASLLQSISDISLLNLFHSQKATLQSKYLNYPDRFVMKTYNNP